MFKQKKIQPYFKEILLNSEYLINSNTIVTYQEWKPGLLWNRFKRPESSLLSLVDVNLPKENTEVID